jgi:hypothetical protein
MPQQLPTPMDPALFAALESDLILPEQFFPEQEPAWSGELMLMWTVFVDGIESFRKEIFRGNELSEDFVETMDWIEETGSDRVFSFENLCETFGLDGEWVRLALLSWRDRQHATMHAAPLASQAA